MREMTRKERHEKMSKQIKELNALAGEVKEATGVEFSEAKLRWFCCSDDRLWLCLLGIGAAGIVGGILSGTIVMLLGGAVIFVIGFYCVLFASSTIGNYVCSKSDAERLEKELVRRKETLQEFAEEKAELEPMERRFEKLESIIVDELGGKLKVRHRLHSHKVKVRFRRYDSRKYNMTEKGYEKLVVAIVEERNRRADKQKEAVERKEIVARFEAELE